MLLWFLEESLQRIATTTPDDQLKTFCVPYVPVPGTHPTVTRLWSQQYMHQYMQQCSMPRNTLWWNVVPTVPCVKMYLLFFYLWYEFLLLFIMNCEMVLI